MTDSTDVESAASSRNDKTAVDIEKAAAAGDVEAAEVRPLSGPRALLLRAQAGLFAGLEVRGVSPVPPEERTVTRYFNVFSIWFCISVSLLP